MNVHSTRWGTLKTERLSLVTGMIGCAAIAAAGSGVVVPMAAIDC